MNDRLRVAVTLEQCWHRVPGGTATSALELGRALPAPARPRPGRRERPPPAPAADPPFAPPIAVRPLPLPRLGPVRGLAPAAAAAGRAGDRAGRRGPRHRGGRCRRRPRPLVVPSTTWRSSTTPGHFTRRGLPVLPPGARAGPARRRRWCCARPQATLDDCVAHGFDPDRLRLVPWGVGADAGRRRRRRSGCGPAYGLARPYVLFVGTIEPRKNLPRCSTAFRAARRDGRRPGARRPEGLERGPRRTSARPRRPGAASSGSCPTPTCAALYAGAAVFCYPSLREGFGLPVLEAMAQGTAGRHLRRHRHRGGRGRRRAAGRSRATRTRDRRRAGPRARRAAAWPNGCAAAASPGPRQYTWERTADLTARPTPRWP